MGADAPIQGDRSLKVSNDPAVIVPISTASTVTSSNPDDSASSTSSVPYSILQESEKPAAPAILSSSKSTDSKACKLRLA
jgi:hypothetical protein